MNELELKRERTKKMVTIGGLVGGAVLAGIFYLFLIQVAVGIVALAAAAAAGFTVVSFAPVVGLKIANARYRALDAERVSNVAKITAAAAENPIETLQNDLIANRRAFKEFEAAVISHVAARDNFKKKVEQFTKQWPARAQEFQEQLARMVNRVDQKQKALIAAQASLKEVELKLEEMKAYWDMAQITIAANKAAGMDTGDDFAKLKSDTAYDAVFDRMNLAFAQLEVAAKLEVSDGNSTTFTATATQASIAFNPSSAAYMDLKSVQDVKQKVKS